MGGMNDMYDEIRRTAPDFTVYVPGSADGSTHDTGNEHFLAFDGPDGSLMAVWTQSTIEGKSDQRIVFSRSTNGGLSWISPRTIAGANADAATGKGMASWGFPLVSNKGRIYVLYNKHVGVNDIFSHTTGLMAGIYSDDNGATWSNEELIPMPRSKWDNADASVPSNWIVWQKPLRLSENKYYTGFTRWISPTKRKPNPLPNRSWQGEDAVIEFMRFENIDDHPSVKDIAISWYCADDNALRVPLSNEHPDHSCAQEPAIIKLPDERLFCVMRTFTDHIYFTISSDKGKTWSKPDVLRYRDNGAPFLHPMSPCPIYAVNEKECFLLYHNHNGAFGGWTKTDSHWHRRPIYIVRGEYRPGAKQPVWFSPHPHMLMDNDGKALGFGTGRADLAMYASVTYRGGEPVLWYPERKYFLLGKVICREMLDGLIVPA